MQPMGKIVESAVGGRRDRVTFKNRDGYSANSVDQKRQGSRNSVTILKTVSETGYQVKTGRMPYAFDGNQRTVNTNGCRSNTVSNRRARKRIDYSEAIGKRMWAAVGIGRGGRAGKILTVVLLIRKTKNHRVIKTQ